MPRGLAKKTTDVIDAATDILVEIAPCSVRAVAYQLFIHGALPSMEKRHVDRLGRALVVARETGVVPWGSIVDETREREHVPSWHDPAAFAEAVRRSYRRDRWQDQPRRLVVASEKGTVRGTLAPILQTYGVDFLVCHGFLSATVARDLAVESASDDRPLHLLYIGDHDPSGRYMSDVDLPRRIERYGGEITVTRLALTEDDLPGLPSFAAETKRGDPRHRWFTERYGDLCVELDAMDPRELRDRVEDAILDRLDLDAWERAEALEQVEIASLHDVLDAWPVLFSNKPKNRNGVAS